ncbi:MAG: glycosyltransferase family 2 protein [Planctomycetota bacterium]
MASPVLSVITFAREDPLAVRHALESLADQVEEHPVEVIVADGSGEPEAVTREFPWVRHLSLPPGPMPVLKGAAIQAAQGEVVAILDPLDAADPDWIRRILEALAGPESVAGIGGTVLPDGDRTGANQAAYLFEYGQFAPPLRAGPTTGDLPGNNVAYRRKALVDWCGDLIPNGFWKPFFHDRIRRRGGELHLCPGMRVHHRTRHRFWPFARRCWNYGRCFGAMRLEKTSLGRRVLFIVCGPVVPLLLCLRHVVRALQHPYNRKLLPRAFLPLLGVCMAWGLGECLGYWLGPGSSCEKVY